MMKTSHRPPSHNLGVIVGAHRNLATQTHTSPTTTRTSLVVVTRNVVAETKADTCRTTGTTDHAETLMKITISMTLAIHISRAAVVIRMSNGAARGIRTNNRMIRASNVTRTTHGGRGTHMTPDETHMPHGR